MKTFLYFVFLLLACTNTLAQDDPHYNETGFFDIHVCNWPENRYFFLALFSTYKFKEVKEIEIFDSENESIGWINLQKYREFDTDKGRKVAFIQHIDIPDTAKNGWYKAKVTMNDNKQYTAEDYVLLESLQQVVATSPKQESIESAPPSVLSWQPVPGSSHYQVFIRDLWDDGKLIYESKLLTEPELKLPPGLLKPGGMYSWRVHARNVNVDPLQGDFNHGSMSRDFTFSIDN